MGFVVDVTKGVEVEERKRVKLEENKILQDFLKVSVHKEKGGTLYTFSGKGAPGHSLYLTKVSLDSAS